jgi:hypothetical protein
MKVLGRILRMRRILGKLGQRTGFIGILGIVQENAGGKPLDI